MKTLKKYILLLPLLTLFLLNANAKADVLPAVCREGKQSSACQEYLDYRDECGPLRGNLTGYPKEALEKRSQEIANNPRCQQESGSNARLKSGQAAYCSQTVYSCGGITGLLKTPWLYIGLVITLVVEWLIIYAFMRKQILKYSLVIILANIVSYLVMTVLLLYISQNTGSALLYWISALILEVLVVLGEALIYKYKMRLSFSKALLISGSANLVSIAIGMVIASLI